MNTADSQSLTRRRFLSGMGATGAVIGVAACGASRSSTGTGNAKSSNSGGGGKLKQVTLILEVAPYSKHAPFFVAKQKGYWKERGLNVSIQSGKGSADAITKVASGAGQFALADSSALIVARANRNVEAKMTCMYHYKNLMSAAGLVSSGINKPKDLPGNTMIAVQGDADVTVLPALGDINGFDYKDINIQIGDFQTEVPAVLTHKVDGMFNFFTAYPPLKVGAENRGEKTTYFLYADYGLDLYNNGIVVMDKYLEQSPDVVRSFNAGFVEGVLYTTAHPGEALGIFDDLVPSGNSTKVAREQLQIAIDHLHVPEVKNHGFGPMSNKKSGFTLDVVKKYFDLKHKNVTVPDVFTNDFVPSGKVPQFN